MRRFVLIITIILLSCVFITLITINQDAKIKEITLWTLQMNNFDEYMYKIIRTYEKEHPNIQIKWVDIPFSEGEKRTLAAIMSDTPPDLINLNPDFSAILAQKETLEPIPQTYVEHFNPEIIEALIYNDSLYSIPWYATSSITYYNKELWNKANILRLPKTYKELATISQKIKNNTGAYAFLPTITENDTMVKILHKHGITETEDFNTERAKKLFSMFQNLYQNDLIPKESITYTHREALEQYMAGKIVFFQGGANFLTMIEENAPSVYTQTDITEQIKGSVGQNDFSVMNFVIPKRAKHKKEALEFCLYLTNSDNQLELAKRTNIIATTSEALNNKFYNDYSSLEAKARSISAKQINKINPIMHQKKNQKEINTQINTTIQAILLNKYSLDTALDKLIKNLQNN